MAQPIDIFKDTGRRMIARFKEPPGDAEGWVSDDFPWSDEEILYQLLDIRADVAAEFLLKGGELSEQMVQPLGCVEVEETDRNECPCEIPSGCYWLKNKHPLPRYIRITSVTGIIPGPVMPKFNPIKWNEIGRRAGHRIASVRNGLYWTTRDIGDGRYLYLYGNRDLEKISVTGIWENPMEAAAYPFCGVQSVEAICNPFDVGFYTDKALINKILPMAWGKLLPVRQTAPNDVKNNDRPRI